MKLEQIEQLLDTIAVKYFKIVTTNYNHIKKHFQIVKITKLQLIKIDKIMKEIDKKTQNQGYYKYISGRIRAEKRIVIRYQQRLLKNNITG